jgi:hypothetical protein
VKADARTRQGRPIGELLLAGIKAEFMLPFLAEVRAALRASVPAKPMSGALRKDKNLVNVGGMHPACLCGVFCCPQPLNDVLYVFGKGCPTRLHGDVCLRKLVDMRWGKYARYQAFRLLPVKRAFAVEAAA